MEELPITLHGSNVLVLGFGRVGKMLSNMLYGIGANVSVAARKYSDLAWMENYGYKPIKISDVCSKLKKYDVIFNSVPCMVLDSNELNNIRKDCLIIDLASKPGGVNFEKAKELGIKAIWALSLPGKVAPVSSAKFIKDTVFNIMNEINS